MTIRPPVRLKPPRSPQPKEADVQRAILDWLAAERIWHIRLNTGAMAGSHKGKRWFVRFGRPGMADILAMPRRKVVLPPGAYQRKLHNRSEKPLTVDNPIGLEAWVPYPLWIEVKAPKGNWTQDQQQFANWVREEQMCYLLARSLEDVIALLK